MDRTRIGAWMCALALWFSASATWAADQATEPVVREEAGRALHRRSVAVAHWVQRLLGEARGARNASAVACLDTKLSQANATTRLVAERVRIAERAGAGPSVTRAHARAVLRVLGARVDELQVEAHRCTDPGATRRSHELVVTVDRRVPSDAIVDVRAEPPDPNPTVFVLAR